MGQHPSGAASGNGGIAVRVAARRDVHAGGRARSHPPARHGAIQRAGGRDRPDGGGDHPGRSRARRRVPARADRRGRRGALRPGPLRLHRHRRARLAAARDRAPAERHGLRRRAAPQRRARAPDDSALLRVFLGGAHDPDAVALGDDQLVATARRDLSAVMGIDAEPTLARVYRWRDAGAQHTVGHLARVIEIERRLAPQGIFVAGSGFRSVGIPDCIADARRAAIDAAGFLERSG